MMRKLGIVKGAVVALFVVLASSVLAGESSPAPHMMYFYNPSCRLCTKTNEVVGIAEEKYKDRMSSQRFNIADPAEGMDNVLYMFDLMDEMSVPEEDNVTLVVFLGVLENDGDELFFTPRRVLVEGEEIIPKLDDAIKEFLNSEEKGVALDVSRPAAFFLRDGAGLAHTS